MAVQLINSVLLTIASGSVLFGAIPNKPFITAWNSCQQGLDTNGNYTYCASGSQYKIEYSSGIYVTGNCSSGEWIRHPNVQASAAADFHARVCGIAGGSAAPTNIYDVMQEIMSQMGQQYNYW